MGVVWKARDTRLGRIVAIKVSQERFSERFDREARAIAALNHPHICTLFDVGPDYLVMEYLEGHGLRGPLPLKTALQYAVQAADALHAAHVKSVIHRDLKPGNILVTKAGIKLLDFGLAKVAAQSAASECASSTTETLTEDKSILGTLQYMSPEQLQGQGADPRSDIFAFGLVLYEVIAGKPAFQASSQASLIAAILKEEPPPLSTLQPLMPAALDRVVRKCMAKDPDARWQSTADLCDELRWIAQSSSGTDAESIASAARPAHRPVRKWLPAALALAVAIGFAGGILWHSSRAPAPTVWSGVLLGGSETAMGPRISPDGQTLAFQAMIDGLTQVAVMQPESGEWQVRTHDRSRGTVSELSWSTDGARIFYDRWTDIPRGVFSIPVLGGEEKPILEDAGWPEALPDGSLMVMRVNAERKRQFFRYWPETGRLQGLPVQANSSFYSAARVSPDGHAAVISGSAMGQGQPDHLFLLDFHSGELRRLAVGINDESTLRGLAITRDGKTVLYASMSGDTARVSTIPITGRNAARTVLTTTHLASYLDSGPDGSLYLDQHDYLTELRRIPPEGGRPRRITTLSRPTNDVAVLADGRTVVAGSVGGRSRLLAFEANKEPALLIQTNEASTGPLGLVGTGEIAFLIGPGPRPMIGLAAVANGRVTRRIPFDHGEIRSLAATPDGRTLFCAADGVVWSIPLAGGDPKKLHAGDFVTVDPSGQYLVVQLIESLQIHLVSVPLNGGPEREISLAGPGPAHLSVAPLYCNAINKAGKLLASLVTPDMWAYSPGIIDLRTGRIKLLPNEDRDDYQYVGWTPDGQVMALAVTTRTTMWKFQPEK